MPYEFFIGWRYLHSGRHSKKSLISLFVSLVCASTGLLLFFATGAKIFGAILTILGAVGTAASILLYLFSAFTAISILGLAIGVSILIWVLSVTSGFQDEFRRKVLGVNAHILVLKYGLDFSEYPRVMQTCEKTPGVVAAAPFVFNEMMMARGQRLTGVLVKGIDPKRVSRVLDLPMQIEEPPVKSRPPLGQMLLSPEEDDDESKTNANQNTNNLTPGVIVGRELARKMELQVGDTVRLISPLSGMDTTAWSAAGEMPRSRDFVVTGIFFSGFNEYDQRLIYVHLREGQRFFDQGDVVTGVDLKVQNVYRSRQLAQHLLDQLGGTPYRTIDWSELNRNLFTALAIQKLFLQIVIGFIVVVAAFNVLAALAMLVVRKTREISILKSMGMSSLGVARIFQSTGLIVWSVGTGLGLLWGLLGGLFLRRYGFPLDPKIYHINELPVVLNPWEFLATALFALLVCVLATLYPALRAGRMNPIAGLRYE